MWLLEAEPHKIKQLLFGNTLGNDLTSLMLTRVEENAVNALLDWSFQSCLITGWHSSKVAAFYTIDPGLILPTDALCTEYAHSLCDNTGFLQVPKFPPTF